MQTTERGGFEVLCPDAAFQRFGLPALLIVLVGCSPCCACTVAAPEDLAQFTLQSTHPLHKTTKVLLPAPLSCVWYCWYRRLHDSGDAAA
jgi:hypothetical protein